MKYVISFTTSPLRIYKLEPVLNALVKQTRKPDLIVLNIPNRFKRTGERYIIPSFLKGKVTINEIKEDLGPATKIVPTVEYLRRNGYKDHDTRIVYLDDDIRYQTTMLESFEKNIPDDDDSVYCCGGFIFLNLKINGIREHFKDCTIAEGYASVCVKLSTFKDDFEHYMSKYLSMKDCFLSDDVILSNYYAKHNTLIKIFSIRGECSIFDLWNNKCILDYGNMSDALHLGANNTSVNNVDRYRNVIKILSQNKERYIKIHFMDKLNRILVR